MDQWMPERPLTFASAKIDFPDSIGEVPISRSRFPTWHSLLHHSFDAK
jgi:hypothetical protein